MSSQQLIGGRIRDRRRDRGLRQTDLAAAIGISPSYLNLIEHNARRIGGKLLLDIARALSVEPGHLIEGAQPALADGLRAAAARSPDQPAELPRVDELLDRFPGWAALVLAQARRIDLLEAQVAELADRLTYDPELAASLHNVITAVTSIHSTASILVSDDLIDADWQRRFHRNLFDDSTRLATSSKMLIAYLEDTAGAKRIAQSPFEDVGRYLDSIDHHLAEVENGTDDPDPDKIVDKATALSPALALPAQRRLLAAWIDRYRQDAKAMPFAAFVKAAQEQRHDPAELARIFGVGPSAVMRRLASLPRGQGHPDFGLAIADGAGGLLVLKRIAGFTLPRVGSGCPLWPIYLSLSQPRRGIRMTVALPGENGPRFLCHAIAEPRSEPGFDDVPSLVATMLVRVTEEETLAEPAPIGPTCRLCPRTGCPARRELSIVGSG